MAQYTSGGCYNLGNLNPLPDITYNSNPGDGSYMDLKFSGGDDQRSAEITFYCDTTSAGTGTSSFHYDYESPTKNYVRCACVILLGDASVFVLFDLLRRVTSKRTSRGHKFARARPSRLAGAARARRPLAALSCLAFSLEAFSSTLSLAFSS